MLKQQLYKFLTVTDIVIYQVQNDVASCEVVYEVSNNKRLTQQKHPEILKIMFFMGGGGRKEVFMYIPLFWEENS